MKICNKVFSICEKNKYFSIQTNCVEIRIMFVTDYIVRIRVGFNSDFSEESYCLSMTAWEDRMDDFMKEHRKKINPSMAKLEEYDKYFNITGNKIKLVIQKEPFKICIYDYENNLLHADIEDIAYMKDSNNRRIHTSEISNDDCFYGFGEKTGDLNKCQKFMTIKTTDAMGYNPKETDGLYKHIPFYIKLSRETKKAVGYFYHNTYECDFNMGRERSNYWKPHSRYRTDGGDIDLFFIVGPLIKDVVERYTDLTGKSILLPRYSLGYLGSSMYYSELEENCDDEIIEFIDTNIEEKIPIDGFQLSSGYCAVETDDGIKRCVFTWNDKRFKNPKEFFKEMNKRGVTVSPNVKPGILLVHPKIEDMKKNDIFIYESENEDFAIGTWWGGKGMFVDFSKQSSREYWKKLLKENVLCYGTSSVWNDNCEYDSIVDADCRCDFDGKGATIAQLKSVMSNIMCHITDEAIKEYCENTRPYIVCRSGYAGIQKYAQTWAGDNFTSWDSLKYNIATILGMGLCGVANHGCDIGGFYGLAPEAELFVRWIQNGIFQPRFSIHSTNTDNTVTEPWIYSDYTHIIRNAINLRYSFSPYLYSLAYRASKSGLPIMEALCSAFQHDENVYDESINFMFGDAIFVANVVEKGAKEREIYFPKEEIFYDFYTRKRYNGGQTIKLPVNIESIPIFLRAGSIFIMSEDKLKNLKTQNTTSIKIICSNDKNARFTLYEDDGISMNYKNGDYLKTDICLSCGEKAELQFNIEGNYDTKIEKISIDMINHEKSPYFVMIDGKKIKRFLHRIKFEQCEFGWYYSQTLKSVQIKYKNPKKNYNIVVSFEQFDMLGM